MPALHRAITLVQMNHASVTVPENLHLDVFRTRNVAFEEHRRIAKRAPRLALRLVEQVREIAQLSDNAHSATTATERCLDYERKINLLRDLQRLGAILDRILSARQSRHADLLCKCAGGGLVTHLAEQIHARPDERDAGLRARLRELRVLGQKTISGVDHLHSLFLVRAR